ncbi:MAG: hypothetical protein C4530_10010, partial [Desulfobacteraceae bacterium]
FLHIDKASGVRRHKSNPTTEERSAERIAAYEAVIDSCVQLAALKADQFFQLTLDQAKTLKIANLKAEGVAHFQAKWDYFEVLTFVTNAAADKTAIKADYDAVKAAFINARNAVNACATVDEVKAVKATWPAL